MRGSGWWLVFIVALVVVTVVGLSIGAGVVSVGGR